MKYTFEFIVAGLVALIVGFLIYDMVTATPATIAPRSGVVAAREFVPAHTRVWTTYGSKGETEVHTSYVPDEYILIVRLDCGITHKFDTTLNEYSRWHEMDRVYLSWKETGVLGLNYGETLVAEGKLE